MGFRMCVERRLVYRYPEQLSYMTANYSTGSFFVTPRELVKARLSSSRKAERLLASRLFDSSGISRGDAGVPSGCAMV